MAQKAELKGKINLDSSGFQRGIAQSKKSVSTFARTLKSSLLPVLGAAGAAGALINLGKGAIQSAKEIKTLAKLSGTGVVEFQKFADAAKTVNVEQDKLADIFKDTSDKIGDFIQSGGGAMAAFFENIAPMVGATTEEFIGLSGPAALQKYFDFLKAAELPHEQMVFYMEAIASDATALIPLLENGGEAFRTLGEGAQAAGRIMSEETILALDRAATAFQRFGTFVKVQAGNVLATIMGMGTPLEEQAKAQLEAEKAFDGLKGRGGTIQIEKMIKARVKLIKKEQAAREKAAADAKKLIKSEQAAVNKTEGQKRREKERNEQAVAEAKTKLLQAEAGQNLELINQAKNELALQEKIKSIMADSNVTRDEAIRLAKQLTNIEAGADLDQSGYITPREQRQFDREQKKRDQERRRKEREERSKEITEDARKEREERDKRMSEREKKAGFGPGADNELDKEASGKKAEELKENKDLNEAAKQTAENTKELLTVVKENP